MTFNKPKAEYDLKVLDIENKFALKMASLICWSVVSIVFALGIFFGDKSLYTFIAVGVIALILGIITFTKTRSALL